MTGFHCTVQLCILSILLGNTVLFAQNVKNEKDMRSMPETFALTKEDFRETVEKYSEYYTPPSPLFNEFVGVSGLSIPKEKQRFQQSIDLKNKTNIISTYWILNSCDKAKQVVHLHASDSAVTSHMMENPEQIGLSKNNVVYEYNPPFDGIVIFQCCNVVVRLAVSSETMNSEEGKKLRNRLSHIIVDRIMAADEKTKINIDGHDMETITKEYKKIALNTRDFAESATPLLIKDKEIMIEEFKKFILTAEDFSESLKKFQEDCRPPVYSSYEFIGKPEISTKDDKIVYDQEIFLKDGTKIFTEYMILETPEDAMKTTNCFASDTAWIARVLYIRTKEELGLEKYAAAFYYDETNDYILTFQYKNLMISVSVHAENEPKEKRIQMCCHLAKTIIKRINITQMEGLGHGDKTGSP